MQGFCQHPGNLLVLHQLRPDTVITGNGVDQQFTGATYRIPGRLIGPNGSVYVEGVVEWTNGTTGSARSFFCRAGTGGYASASATNIFNPTGITNSRGGIVRGKVMNRNAWNSQLLGLSVIAAGIGLNTGGSTTLLTSTIDTQQDWFIYMGAIHQSGDTATLRAVDIWCVPK